MHNDSEAIQKLRSDSARRILNSTKTGSIRTLPRSCSSRKGSLPGCKSRNSLQSDTSAFPSSVFPAFRIRHFAFDISHSALCIRHFALSISHSAFRIRHFAFETRYTRRPKSAEKQRARIPELQTTRLPDARVLSYLHLHRNLHKPTDTIDTAVYRSCRAVFHFNSIHPSMQRTRYTSSVLDSCRFTHFDTHVEPNEHQNTDIDASTTKRPQCSFRRLFELCK